jgi:hypothetical protein
MTKKFFTPKSWLISLHDPPQNFVVEIAVQDHVQNFITEGVVGGQTVQALCTTLTLNSI